MAFRQIINKVLTRLREETIATNWTGDILDSSDVDDYQKLISELVNETKQLVEDSWGWGVLRAIQTVTTSNGTAEYTLSNLDNRSRILQVIDDSNDSVLSQMSDDLFYRYTFVGTTQTSNPSFFRLNNNKISFWPTPDSTYTVRIHAVQPQGDLTEATEALTVPEHIVILGAYSLAITERGEDGGSGSGTAAQRFQDSLSDAITQDQNRTVNETTWYAS
jgi:hypothetical protein|tara:strand:- start:18197 stop:18853 length:657 start_codon:yes stop_codon:yes gene_type:complete